MRDRLAISGIGMVCPGGLGREALVRALTEGQTAEAPYRVPDFALEGYLENARAFRRVAGVTKYALAAMALASADAGFSAGAFGGERVGLIVGITHCAVTYSVQFHRTLVLEGPLVASPLFFSESVPNAPAGNGAIAFQIRGPVHTLIGEEPVGTQAIDLAAVLLRGGLVDRCLVVGTEEWNEVVEHAYGQIDRAAWRTRDPDVAPPLSEGAAALVVELESAAVRRGAAPHAVISGWSLDRCRAEGMEAATGEVVRQAFRPTAQGPAEADHVLLPTGRFRQATRRGVVAARGQTAGPPVWIDLLPLVGNPPGASNLLEVAASAALISAGRVGGPGVTLSTGIEGTLSAVVLSRAEMGAKAGRT
ncbi:MAG TPA: beta-ketoacyl synthase N-terminal-like domain-containing protein [Candidatus Methylomirabilis sp.]|nr:beta-ketoacyl synthase N-terminal-like domain-containing protein [Candidatus Methylomirabilis sp.]